MQNDSTASKRLHASDVQRRSVKLLPQKLAGAYFIVAVLWIALSHGWLDTAISVPVVLNHLESLEDLLFAALTALMLYWFSQRSLRTLHAAEVGLQRSEERLRLILQNMPVMLDAFDDQGNIVTWNQECERVTGYSAAEIIGNPKAMTLLYPEADYRQTMVAAWTERGNDYRNWEWNLVCKDGSHRTIAWSNVADRSPIPDWRAWSIGVDITELKQAEADLRVRNQKLAMLHTLSEITLQQQSLKAVFQAIVKEISAATEFPIIAIELYDAVRQMMVFEGTEGIPLPPDGQPIEVPVSQTASGTVVQSGQMLVKTYDASEPKTCDSNESLSQLGLRTFICVPVTINGTTIGTLSLAHPDVVEPQADFLQWLTSLANYLAVITDQKRSEAALRESEARFRLMTETIQDVFWLCSADQAQLLYVSPAYEQIWGRSYASIKNLRSLLETIHPDDQVPVRDWLARTDESKAPFEYRIIKPDGSIRWIAHRFFPVNNAVGHDQTVGISRDITEQKEVEIALRENEEFFKLALDFTHIGSWDWRITTNQVIWNDNHARLLGLIPGDVPASYQAWRDRVHPEDIARVEQAVNEALATKTNFEAEYRLLHLDGSQHWVIGRGRGIYDAAGQVIRMIGVILDITDRKGSEIALRQSEEQFRSLSACSPVGIYLANSEGYGTYTNPRCREIFGFTLEESAGNGWAKQVHPDDRERVLQGWLEVATAGKPYVANYRIQPHNDLVRWVQTRTAPMYADDGTLMGHVGTIEDITDRQQSEQEIQQLNQALEQQNVELEALVEQRTAELMTFINTLPDYIFVVERDTMRMAFCNDLIAKLIGWESRSQVAGKTIFECYAPDLAATFAEQNQRVFETGETLHFQEAYTTSLGTLNFDTYKIPLKKPNGEVYALIGTSRDISELVKARQTLADRTVQLEAANRELESFSYSVSHDLRAPLRHLTGFVAALNDRLDQNGHLTDPTVSHYLQILQSSSQTMGQLIDGLLTLSRVGRRQKAHVPVNLNQVVATVLAQRPENTASDRHLLPSDEGPQAQVCVSELPTVMGDATLLQQVFANLIDNAVKFSRVHDTSAKQNFDPAQIEIGSLSGGIIFVRDHGVGFQMEYADQLFGAFQRLHSKSEFEGNGIGLAIVQRIIHRHGGKIWAESQPNEGATFYFQLGDAPELGALGYSSGTTS
ncbi:MAG: PAS domain S-box protein [Stenomitos rutilans HA7619-LM2]|jgi:PAS domain S-box-containing protein|nr:PAS domain S-box protein [Stenomitos rutilans HA7619-LM2]